MRLAFFGSDPFAVPTLTALAEAEHAISLVVTNPDRRRGRSKALLPTAVKTEALRLGATVLQPPGKPLREVAERIRAEGVELGVVVAYGQFLGRRVREAPSLGYTINLHGSLLPRWRGAAPVAAAILAGDAETGVSVQRVAARMDAGDVLCERAVPIGPEDTRGDVRERLAEVGAGLMVEAVATIARGEARFTPQDEERVTLAPKLGKTDGRVTWDLSCLELDRRVRGLSPWPCAFFELETGRLQVLEARPLPGESGEPGTVLAMGAGELIVAAGAGALALRSVKPLGKRPMDGRSYANGRRLEPGAKLA